MPTPRLNLFSLQWCHNGRDDASNHQPHDCLLNRLFRRRSKKTSKLRVTGLCAGNSPVTGEFPSQSTSNVENVSIWWRHHVVVVMPLRRMHSSKSYSWSYGSWQHNEVVYFAINYSKCILLALGIYVAHDNHWVQHQCIFNVLKSMYIPYITVNTHYMLSSQFSMYPSQYRSMYLSQYTFQIFESIYILGIQVNILHALRLIYIPIIQNWYELYVPGIQVNTFDVSTPFFSFSPVKCKYSTMSTTPARDNPRASRA